MKKNMTAIQQEVQSRVLIAAHRDVAGGKRTVQLYDVIQGALRQDADSIELDITRSNDGIMRRLKRQSWNTEGYKHAVFK